MLTRFMKGLGLALCAALIVVTTGVAQAPAQGASAPADASSVIGTYVIGTGDKLRVLVFGENELSGDFFVSDNGDVSLPLVGNIPAQGVTVQEFEGRLATALRNGYIKDPRVSVQVLSYSPFYISGEVNKPGSYPYVVGLDVQKAVAMAGGYTYRANKKKVLLTRADKKDTQKVSLKSQVEILPGDVIVVPERYF